jgi:hypothetical protein
MSTCRICGADAEMRVISGWLYLICTTNPDHQEEIDRYGD